MRGNPGRTLLIVPLLLAMLAQGCAGGERVGGHQVEQGDIALDPATTFQTIVGWEAHNQAGQHDVPQFPQYSGALLDMVVHDLGISRIRLEVRSGMENRIDVWQEHKAGRMAYDVFRCGRWEVVNDNDDPNLIDPAGFHFSMIDEAVERVILPMRQRLTSRGERLYLNLNYVSFTAACNDNAAVHRPAAEYAELILATFQHLDRKYGVIPDAVEIILEPDLVPGWSGTRIGQAIVATGARLEAAGYRPDFIAPSTTAMDRVASYFDEIIAVPGVSKYMREISYHRYTGESTASLQAIASRAVQHGLRTAMLERIGADHHTLHEDLKLGRVSAWQQFAIAFTGSSPSGEVLIGIDLAGNPPRPFFEGRTKFLRQYFKFVRPGAVRIGATSALAAFDPVAFINRSGGYVVVVKAAAGGTFTVAGLPAGRYGVLYTTAGEFDVHRPDIAVSAGRLLETSIPAAGVLSIYAK